MSIDFATLQGLSIPEGVVTKIEDAAGNVLWSAAVQELISGTMYLRPSADVEFDHTQSNGYVSSNLSAYPATLQNRYLAINEEVADGNATYLYSNDVYANQSESRFLLSSSVLHGITNVTAIRIEGQAYYANASYPGDLKFSLYINDENAFTSSDISQLGSFAVDASSILTVINTYLTNNGAMPEIVLSVRVSGGLEASDDIKGAGDVYHNYGVSQVYMVIDYQGVKQ